LWHFHRNQGLFEESKARVELSKEINETIQKKENKETMRKGLLTGASDSIATESRVAGAIK
jgi:hypothetical protein